MPLRLAAHLTMEEGWVLRTMTMTGSLEMVVNG